MTVRECCVSKLRGRSTNESGAYSDQTLSRSMEPANLAPVSRAKGVEALDGGLWGFALECWGCASDGDGVAG